MCKTRLEAVDNRLVELGYPDCVLSMLHEDLLCFARNFAAEADRLEATVADLLAACKRTEWVGMDSLVAHRCPTCHNPKENGHRHDCKMKQAIDKAEGKGATP